MNVFRTICVPASTNAPEIANALGNGMQGMFGAVIDSGPPPDPLDVYNPIVVGYISSGILDDGDAILGTPDEISAALDALGGAPIPHDQITAFCQSRDMTQDDPHLRMDELIAEVEAPITDTATAWLAGTYAKDVIVEHTGRAWKSLIDGNVWKPGEAAWRLLWGATGLDPAPWIQPSGSTDFYNIGDKVTFNGGTYTSTIHTNVWSPAVTGWENDNPTADWAAGTSYAIGDEVDHLGLSYSCIQAHTAQFGWEPPNVPALWGVI